MLYVRENCVHVGASLSHKGFTAHTLQEKHCQELTHGPMHSLSGVGCGDECGHPA